MKIVQREKKLWFGVEKGYLTTELVNHFVFNSLWFGVEKGYLTTADWRICHGLSLWFGVEKGYLTTESLTYKIESGCGLV